MKINLELLKELQEDAMLDLSEKELAKILEYENHLLDKFEKVLLINTDNVEPLHYPFDLSLAYLRDDEETKTILQKDILQNAPSTDGDFVTIPKVVN